MLHAACGGGAVGSAWLHGSARHTQRPTLSCRCVVTESYYTKGEEFAAADAVFDCIGEEGEERFKLHDLTTPGTPPAAVAAAAAAC